MTAAAALVVHLHIAGKGAKCGREALPTAMCLSLPHRCYTWCVVSHESRLSKKDVEGRWNKNQLRLANRSCASTSDCESWILVHNAKHSTESRRFGNYADILTDISYCMLEVLSDVEKLAEIESNNKRSPYISLMALQQHSWEITASRPRSRLNSMLMLMS